MITIQNLSKRYGNNTVLKDISIQLEAGKIYGLVGANGCGKTTLMRCICGFSHPTTGYAQRFPRYYEYRGNVFGFEYQ